MHRFDLDQLGQGHEQGHNFSSRLIAHITLVMLIHGFTGITSLINAVETLLCQILVLLAQFAMDEGHN